MTREDTGLPPPLHQLELYLHYIAGTSQVHRTQRQHFLRLNNRSSRAKEQERQTLENKQRVQMRASNFYVDLKKIGFVFHHLTNLIFIQMNSFCVMLWSWTSVSFFLENFRQISSWKKYDFDLYKGFLMGKMAQICQISNFKNSKSPESYDNFQKVATNIKGFYFFLPSYLLHSQIWLLFFLDNRHFANITKSLKETLLQTHVTKENFGFYKRTQHRLNSILELKKVWLLAENQLKIGAIGSTLEHEPKESPKLKAFQNWKPCPMSKIESHVQCPSLMNCINQFGIF